MRCSYFVEFIKLSWGGGGGGGGKGEGGGEIKCEACQALSLFRNKFNKFNNTGA